MTAELPDDELVNVPLGNLLPGELQRAFRVMTEHTARKLEEQSRQMTALLTAHQREEETKEQEQEEVHEREALLLDRIHEREREIQQEAALLDTRTIKLDDGRRAYVDKDGFRDAEGQELHGADRAQAEQHQLTQPNAATWQEHEELERRWQATEQLRYKVDNLQNGRAGTTPDGALAGYEKEFAAHQAANPTVPDYGNGDYMSAFGLSGSFKASAAGLIASPAAVVASQPATVPRMAPVAP